MSRLLLFCAAMSWAAWLVVSPVAWTGCKFSIGPIYIGKSVKVTVKVAGDMDLTKVETVYARITGAHSEQRKVDKPQGGWPAGAEFRYYPDSGGKILITISAYDSANHLIGLGAGESENYSDVEIVLSARIPWD